MIISRKAGAASTEFSVELVWLFGKDYIFQLYTRGAATTGHSKAKSFTLLRRFSIVFTPDRGASLLGVDQHAVSEQESLKGHYSKGFGTPVEIMISAKYEDCW